MKVIVAGSRTITGTAEVWDAIRLSGFVVGKATEIVSGGCAGPDLKGESYARAYEIPVRRFPADWKRYGRRAGPLRNEEMACYADALVAVWDGRSPGTADMIRRARAHGLRVYVHTPAHTGGEEGGR